LLAVQHINLISGFLGLELQAGNLVGKDGISNIHHSSGNSVVKAPEPILD
jgi:hypothetical protein